MFYHKIAECSLKFLNKNEKYDPNEVVHLITVGSSIQCKWVKEIALECLLEDIRPS